MDSNSNVSQSILQSTMTSSDNSLFSSNSNEGGFFDTLKSISLTTWLLIILILAFLGFNVFAYLAKGTDFITNVFSPFFKATVGSSTNVGGQIVDVSAEGAKEVVSQAADVAEGTLTAIQNITPNSPNVRGETFEKPKEDNLQRAPLNQALNNRLQMQQQQMQQQQMQQQQMQPEFNYSADNADSSIQGGGKSGWCYIGQDRGFRSCAQVGVNDTCISGDIFPTHEICINPSLRR